MLPMCNRALPSMFTVRSSLDGGGSSRRPIIPTTKHEWGRKPSDEDIVERLELRQRSEGDLVYKTCERAAEPQPVPWQDWIEQRLAQEREHIITLLGEVVAASWRRQRRENKRELADELRTLRIEIASFSAELSELRAITAAERGGKVLCRISPPLALLRLRPGAAS